MLVKIDPCEVKIDDDLLLIKTQLLDISIIAFGTRPNCFIEKEETVSTTLGQFKLCVTLLAPSLCDIW